MKLVRFTVNGQPARLGNLVSDQVWDLGATYEQFLAGSGVTRAAELAGALFHGSTRDFLQAGAVAEAALAQMDEAVKAGKLTLVSHRLGSVRLLAPIRDPEKLICIGLNYKDHAEEAGQAGWSVCAKHTLRRQASKVRTVCVSSASTGPCGGRSAMAVPTATSRLLRRPKCA